ncbi:PREDICTED: uncharacterized protein LOC109219646 [Nicotiana attenuata]|uniref:Uncharacterized protein n=1 Tax=Nicotiana attenuata TaxID=49451 RepID=A0A1J6JWK8_NICAT|nr:PREDICTED: uncharacterized protein LOC109219646 [Nicotiana attenuata]OIT20844.1 hypothetical protein A4A49_36509 [Nicotiana attenuata]
MKFFVELVACCGCNSSRVRQVEAEEMGPLVPAAAETSSDDNNNNSNKIVMYKRRKRGRRVRARSAGSFPDWKPSLSSISEDHDALPTRMAVNSNRNLKKNATASRHHHRDKVRIACFSGMGPAFAPTPFLI